MLRTQAPARLLFASLFAALLGGCATYRPATVRDSRPGQASEILGVRVVHESAGFLDLEVDYRYDDAVGACAFIGATTQCSGAASCKDSPAGSWAFQPMQIEPGRHRARVLVLMNSESPATAYDSDELQIELYEGGGGDLVTAYTPYPKHWQREPAPYWARTWAWCKVPARRRCS